MRRMHQGNPRATAQGIAALLYRAFKRFITCVVSRVNAKVPGGLASCNEPVQYSKYVSTWGVALNPGRNPTQVTGNLDYLFGGNRENCFCICCQAPCVNGLEVRSMHG
jgi:hypothetical protein